MGRRNRRRSAAPRSVGAWQHTPDETVWRGGREVVVRSLRGNDSGRVYRCPGCNHEVYAKDPHVLVWPADGMRGLEDRRHWHIRCWRAT